MELFVYEGSTVRAVERDGQPWFVGKDVAQVLGYSEPTKAAREKVDEEDKGVSKIDTPGGVQEVLIINESGLYSLILSSKLPGAKKFKRWVTSEVLPAIRRHGLYAVDEVLQNPDILINALVALKNEREQKRRLEMEVAMGKQQIAELQPKATYYDIVLACKDVVPITRIAKDYGRSAKWLNKVLKEKGVQFKQGDMWILYQKYAEKGYTQSKTYAYEGREGESHARMHTYWTQKGRLFIYDLLKADGILPNIEKE